MTATRISSRDTGLALDRDFEAVRRATWRGLPMTLDHIVDTLFLYAAYLASRGTERLPPPRNGDQNRFARAAPGDRRRGRRRAGRGGARRADGHAGVSPRRHGRRLLLDRHGRGGDPAPHRRHRAGTGTTLPAAGRPLGADLPLFPSGRRWTSTCWDSSRWAAGRAALLDRERLGPDWYWHWPLRRNGTNDREARGATSVAAVIRADLTRYDAVIDEQGAAFRPLAAPIRTKEMQMLISAEMKAALTEQIGHGSRQRCSST